MFKKHETQMNKLINTGFTLKTLFNDSCDSIVVPISMMSSFLVTKEQKPIKLNSIDYKVNSSEKFFKIMMKSFFL